MIHGIPSKERVIREGDIVSIDLGAALNGFNGDNAATFAAGPISPEAKRLIDTTRESLYEGIRAAVAGGRIGDIGSAVQRYCRGTRLWRRPGIYRDMAWVQSFMKIPWSPNFGTPGRGVRLLPGMTLAIEPMINQGTAQIKSMPDGWTVKTADGKLSAHFEHTVAITADGPQILTQV